jgi:predicted DNA-binding transcriptional regulator YafY
MTKKERAFGDAVDMRLKMRLRYTSAGGEVTTRVICPMSMDEGPDGKWSCGAWCETAGGHRTFKMARVTSYEVLAERFDVEGVVQ